MTNIRIMKIVDVLLKQNTYITIDKISEALHVSNKTIRNDLQIVGDWLDEYHLKLIKKTGVGILIEGSEQDKLHVMEHMQNKNRTFIEYSPQARKLFIGMQLCSFDNCRIYELSSQLYVSRATIHKDLSALSDLLTTYDIDLHRKNNNGLSMVGKEKNIRNFLLELMLRDNGYHKFIEIVQNSQYSCDGSFIFAGLEASDDEVKDFMNCLLSSNSKYLNALPFQSLVLVLLRMYVSYLRITDHHYIKLSKQFLDELNQESCYPEARILCERIGNHYRIIFPEMEIRYMQVYLLALQSSDHLNTEDKALAKSLTDLLLHSWSEQLQLPFHQDDDLRLAVYAHLCPAIMRFRHGIPNENPLLPEIHSLYRETFKVTKNSISCINETFNCTCSNDEIGFLALHLAASIERMKKPLRTILVSHNGAGAATLLKNKISATIPETKIVGVETFITIFNHNLEDIDLIISTIDIKLHQPIPVIQVNSLLHHYDIVRLHEVVKKLYNQKNDPLNFKTTL